MAFDEQWRAVADSRTSRVSAISATSANVPSLKKNRKKKVKMVFFSSFYSNWHLALVAQVALTHHKGGKGKMLYMADWRQQTTPVAASAIKKPSLFIEINRQLTSSKSVSFLEKVGKLLGESR